jgi:hypothetical protein
MRWEAVGPTHAALRRHPLKRSHQPVDVFLHLDLIERQRDDFNRFLPHRRQMANDESREKGAEVRSLCAA